MVAGFDQARTGLEDFRSSFAQSPVAQQFAGRGDPAGHRSEEPGQGETRMFGKPLVSTLIPLGIVFVSGALGMFLQKIVLARLRRTAEKSAASWADILTKSLHERFAREGIEIPFPARTVQLRKNEE
jgi:hypothetical protein